MNMIIGPKAKTLAHYLCHCPANPIEITESSYDKNTFDAEGAEYLVLSDDEATEYATDYIKDSVWAFNASFLVKYGVFRELDCEHIEQMRGDSCEAINPAFIAMLGDSFDSFVDDAIGADGRGHFISSYDGNEIEHGDYFIYRTN